jgi:hypothetical protein
VIYLGQSIYNFLDSDDILSSTLENWMKSFKQYPDNEGEGFFPLSFFDNNIPIKDVLI